MSLMLNKILKSINIEKNNPLSDDVESHYKKA